MVNSHLEINEKRRKVVIHILNNLNQDNIRINLKNKVKCNSQNINIRIKTMLIAIISNTKNKK